MLRSESATAVPLRGRMGCSWTANDGRGVTFHFTFSFQTPGTSSHCVVFLITVPTKSDFVACAALAGPAMEWVQSERQWGGAGRFAMSSRVTCQSHVGAAGARKAPPLVDISAVPAQLAAGPWFGGRMSELRVWQWECKLVNIGRFTTLQKVESGGSHDLWRKSDSHWRHVSACFVVHRRKP